MKLFSASKTCSLSSSAARAFLTSRSPCKPRIHLTSIIASSHASEAEVPGTGTGPASTSSAEASTRTKPAADDFLGTQELAQELLSDKKGLGRRGEALTLAQVICLLLVLFPPLKLSGLFEFLALGLIVSGITFGLYAVYSLGRSFSPLPTPRTKHKLVTHGAYRYCRHPLYGGLIMSSLGLASYTASEARLLFTLVLCLILSFKSQAEEAALTSLYGEEYKAYELRVKKFIPYFF